MEIRRSRTPEETRGLGSEVGRRIRPGDVLFLEGDLAAGKTVFVQGLVEGLGGDPADVSSPTFVILQTYAGEFVRVHHVDCYRLREDSLAGLGLEDVFADPEGVAAIEWPDRRIEDLMGRFQRLIRIRIHDEGDGARMIEISGLESAGKAESNEETR